MTKIQESAGAWARWLRDENRSHNPNAYRLLANLLDHFATPPTEIEWQIRGRHHYEWRKTTEVLAAEMHRVNPLHVRAVTVVTGAVPKGGA